MTGRIGSAALSDPQTSRLATWQRLGLVAFFGFWVAFAGLVELRSAFLSRRLGDLDCFLRGAWAIRTGADPYAVTDDNGFHYNYPPFLAVLLWPLADPPAGADRTGMLPFPVSVGICYFLNLVLLAFSVHWLASALEEATPGWSSQPCWTRRWWGLRVGPIVLCLVPVAHTVMRGQANILVLAFLCASLRAIIRRRSFAGGFWLSGAICIKIFPAFLLLFPLWRRDGRCLAGCAAGLITGLLLVPLLAMGPSRTVDSYARLADVLIFPGLGGGGDKTRAEELTNITATDSQSLLAVWHKTLYYGDPARPKQASTTLRALTTMLCGLITLITLLAAGWRPSTDSISTIYLFGCLVLNMLLLCPVCHLHYFSMAIPLVMALMAASWQARPTLGITWVLLWLVVTVALVWPNLPDMTFVRDIGLAMYAGLLLWALGIAGLWRRRHKPAAPAPVPMPLAA